MRDVILEDFSINVLFLLYFQNKIDIELTLRKISHFFDDFERVQNLRM
jgi:hypothetical protein